MAGYLLEEQVGAGGMAVVFRAVDERLERQVAVKVLAPGLAADEAFRRRFLRESRAAAAVDDPHIIPVHEAGESGGVLFIAMRYVPGPDVKTLLADVGPLPPARVAAIVSPVASALDAAHAAGLVHRDVKPANMLLDVRPGRPDHVYLSDFGLAKAALASAALTVAGQFLGTPAYAAPEQIEGRRADGRTDQYALACAAFEMLTGHPPFERDQGMAVIWAHLNTAPPPLASVRPGLPTDADRVLARALAKVPEQRYPTCTAFSDALRTALGLAPYHSAPDHEIPVLDHAVTEIAQLTDDAGQVSQLVTVAGVTPGPPADQSGTAPQAQDGETLPEQSASAGGPKADAGSTAEALAGPVLEPPVSLVATAAPGVTAAPPSGPGPAKPALPVTRPELVQDVADGKDASADGEAIATTKPTQETDGGDGEAHQQITQAVRAHAAAPTVSFTTPKPRRRAADQPAAERRRRRKIRVTVAGIGIAAVLITAIILGNIEQPLHSGPAHAPPSGHTTPNAAKTTPSHEHFVRMATFTDPNRDASPGAVALSSLGGALAVGDDHGRTYLWNTATGSLTATLTDPHTGEGGVQTVAFSPDGNLVAAGDDNGSTYLWNTATGSLVATLNDSFNSLSVNAVAFSPVGGTLAVGDEDDSTFLWNTATGGLITTLNDRGGRAVTAVAFSGDGKILAVGDVYGIYLWNTATGRRITILTAPNTGNAQLNAVAFSSDGRLTATLTDPHTGQFGASAVAFSRDGKILAAGGFDTGSVYLWDMATDRMFATLTPPGNQCVGGLAFGRHANTLADADCGGTIYLWKYS